MLENLRPGFEKETGFDLSLPEYIVFHFIYKIFQHDRETLANIIWADENRPRNLHQVELRDIIEPLYQQGTKSVEKLQLYYNENKLRIRELFKIDIYGTTYEIKRADNKRILNLFRVIDEDDPEYYLEKIIDADNSLFQNNDELITFFNDLMRYYICTTYKLPILLIGIDEVAKADSQIQDYYYKNLGNLFVRLRNILNYTLFVFISTTADWNSFDQIISKNSDLQGQLAEFTKKMPLKQLEVNELIQVFKNRMNRFWKNYPSQQPPITPYYPFSESFFEYVYRFKKRNLRKSIHSLRDLWINFKYKNFIPKYETMFESMREIQDFKKFPFDPNELKRFEWRIIRNSFNNPSRFKNNTKRSSSVEKGIENAWKCLSFEDPPTITNVQNNPRIYISKEKYRRPDVYITIHGNLGAEYRRDI